ncbi:MAG: calcium:proton antiporter [Epsilonproteobacteria bacterium]|nr:calcium:proton antiporter [Campylobacterota bacterium]
MIKNLVKEYPLVVSVLAVAIFMPFEHFFAHSLAGNVVGFLIVFGVIIYSAVNVAHHAEILAYKYGEPYGTLILTSSAVIVEILIIAIMMSHAENPTLARDTIYSAVMLDINALLGIAAIIGGIKYGEQEYNVDSTNSYMSMILVSIGIAMIVPHFISDASLGMYMNFTIVMFILLYVIFTRIQLKEHRYFFEHNNGNHQEHNHSMNREEIPGGYHAGVLALSIVMIGLLSEVLAVFMGNNLEVLGLPLVLGAFSVALISAAPELITAIRAAQNNNMQTVVNIAVGASLATVLLTIPAILIVSKIMGMEIDLALTPIQGIMLGLTILAGIIHFNDGETNMLEGFVHLVIFIVFFFLMFV